MKRYFKVLLPALAAISMSVSCSRHCDESATYMLRPRDIFPSELGAEEDFTRVFLAGTIDMGRSRDWQAEMKEWFSEKKGRFLLYNPRRENWRGGEDGEMEYQVCWELEHLEKADYIIMNILGSSKSPITLLEMGLHARSGKLYVACEPDFYRYDNVRITCTRYGIPLYDSLEELLEAFPLN